MKIILAPTAVLYHEWLNYKVELKYNLMNAYIHYDKDDYYWAMQCFLKNRYNVK